MRSSPLPPSPSQRYNTLDFAGKVVCHETPARFLWILPAAVPIVTAKAWPSLLAVPCFLFSCCSRFYSSAGLPSKPRMAVTRAATTMSTVLSARKARRRSHLDSSYVIGPGVQYALKQSRENEYIVDLVGIVAAGWSGVPKYKIRTFLQWEKSPFFYYLWRVGLQTTVTAQGQCPRGLREGRNALRKAGFRNTAA